MPVCRASCSARRRSRIEHFSSRPARNFRRRIVLGLDARDGKVAVKGWTAVSETKAIDLLKELSGYRDRRRDLYRHRAGWHAEWAESVCVEGNRRAYSPFPVIASGGITRMEDLQAVRSLGPQIEGAIVGKALYDGKLDYRAALAALR